MRGGKEMVIVSQRKDKLVNFDRIESIWIDAEEDGRFTIKATSDTNSTLGTYSTEERAKEVLQKIIRQKSIFEYFKNVPKDIQNLYEAEYIFDTYEMPKK